MRHGRCWWSDQKADSMQQYNLSVVIVLHVIESMRLYMEYAIEWLCNQTPSRAQEMLIYANVAGLTSDPASRLLFAKSWQSVIALKRMIFANTAHNARGSRNFLTYSNALWKQGTLGLSRRHCSTGNWSHFYLLLSGYDNICWPTQQHNELLCSMNGNIINQPHWPSGQRVWLLTY